MVDRSLKIDTLGWEQLRNIPTLSDSVGQIPLVCFVVLNYFLLSIGEQYGNFIVLFFFSFISFKNACVFLG